MQVCTAPVMCMWTHDWKGMSMYVHQRVNDHSRRWDRHLKALLLSNANIHTKMNGQWFSTPHSSLFIWQILANGKNRLKMMFNVCVCVSHTHTHIHHLHQSVFLMDRLWQIYSIEQLCCLQSFHSPLLSSILLLPETPGLQMLAKKVDKIEIKRSSVYF